MSVDKQALLAEEQKLRRLRRAMDIAATLLWQVDLTLEEARDVVNHAKHTALQLFPDKEETFDLIYGSRFRRILVEKYHLQRPCSGSAEQRAQRCAGVLEYW